MNILFLPDAALREVMKMVEIKDRLRLRLTCRALKQLVADTDAAYSNRAFLSYHLREGDKKCLTISLGWTMFSNIDYSEMELSRFLHFIDQLFSSISIEEFVISLTEDIINLEFIRSIKKKFKIQIFRFIVGSQEILEKFLILMSDSPGLKYMIELKFHPDTDVLLSLPPLEKMTLYSKEVPATIFLDLMRVQRKLYMLRSLSITKDEWKAAAQIVADDERKRDVRFNMESASIRQYLNEFGLVETMKPGDRFGEFEFIAGPDGKLASSSLQIRYGKCLINVVGLDRTERTCEMLIWMRN